MIQCTHVYKRYKNGTNALYDINLSVDQGEFVYVIGPTGSGKSTLIKLMDAEEMCTKGNVKVVGIDVGELSKRQIPIYRRNIGVVFQDYKLLPHLTVFENIAYASIKASNTLAKERGSYQYFEGSEWESGAYFDARGYDSARWKELKEEVHATGMRNAYVLAIAPTSSTSILIGTSAGLDPVMNRFFLEEKKGSILPRTAPELSADTYWYYKTAHTIDQTWSVRAAGIRQRHIDQAQSFNLWITNDYKMSQLLQLYVLAYDCGVKTIYYTRSKALDPEDCESCSA